MADYSYLQRDDVPGVGEATPPPPSTDKAPSGGFFSSFGKFGIGPGMGGVQRPPMGVGPGAAVGTASPDDAMVQGASGNEGVNIPMQPQSAEVAPAPAAAPDPNVPPTAPAYISTLPDGDKLWARYNELQKQENDLLGRASYAPPLENMPTYQPREFNWKVFAGFAGIATIMAAALGKASGAGIEGAMGALGSALKGYAEGHMAEAENHRKDFYAQVNRTLKQNESVMQQFDAVQKSAGNNLKLLEAEMTDVARKNNMAIAMDAYNKGGLPAMMQSVDQMKRLDAGMFTTLVKTLGQLDKAKNLGTLDERDRQFAVQYSEMKRQQKPTTPADDKTYNMIIAKYGKERKIDKGDGTIDIIPGIDIKEAGLYTPPGYKGPENVVKQPPQAVAKAAQSREVMRVVLDDLKDSLSAAGPATFPFRKAGEIAGTDKKAMQFERASEGLRVHLRSAFFAGSGAISDYEQKIIDDMKPHLYETQNRIRSKVGYIEKLLDAMEKGDQKMWFKTIKDADKGMRTEVATSPQSVLSAKIGTSMTDEKGNQFTVTEELKAKIRAAGVR